MVAIHAAFFMGEWSILNRCKYSICRFSSAGLLIFNTVLGVVTTCICTNTFAQEVSSVTTMEIVRTSVVPPAPRNYPSLRMDEALSDGESIGYLSKYSESPNRLGFRSGKVYAPRFGIGRRKSFSETIGNTLDHKSTKDSLLNIDLEDSIGRIENPDSPDFRTNFRDKGKASAPEGIEFDLDGAHFDADSLEADLKNGLLRIEGHLEVNGTDSHLSADNFFLQRETLPGTSDEDRVHYHLLPHGHNPYKESSLGDGVLEVSNLIFEEPNRAFKADYIRYDSKNHNGELTKLKGYAEPFYFSAEGVRILGPGTFEADDIWLTTCDLEEPHYRIRFSQARVEDGLLVVGKRTKLQLGKRRRTFFYLPKISGLSFADKQRLKLELDVGQRSELGYFANFAQWYEITPNVDVAYRIYPTANEGIGGGIDVEYDFTQNPASRLFGAKGEFEALYTTEKRGFHQWYHRQKMTENLTMLRQWEQWYDRDFVKDFYNDDYEDRSGPRTFTNLTYLKDQYIVSASASKSTHDFTNETEKLPEVSFHLLERSLGNGFYFSMDSTAGYYNYSETDLHARRFSQVARLSYDWDVMRGLNIVPFVEGSVTEYSSRRESVSSDTRFNSLVGVTAQARFQRGYSGFGKFSGFKHIFVPSVTYFQDNASSLGIEDVPRFDDIDNRPARDRVESKFDNIILGRNSANGETWRVAKLTFYQGSDLSNEVAKGTDYEIDVEIRPRPWWGFRAFAEQHRDETKPGFVENDFDRRLAFVFYDDNNYENSFNARLGYSLTNINDVTIDREVLYGVGYKLSPKWSFSADHTFDLENSEIRRQSYQIRRRLHKWDMGLRLRERPSGTDINIVMSLVGFSGAELRF